jgi:ribosomal protein L11 methyltransferase
MTDYYNYQVSVEESRRDAVLAFLTQLPFDTFEETATGLNAFVPVEKDSSELEKEVEKLSGQFEFSYQKIHIPYQNWNEVWESRFEPITIGTFCAVRAEFHPPQSDVQHEIIIRPKMAFGTGHHATTYMMMAAMEHLDFQDAKVLDYGCGTGILAILAEMLGATDIDAVDIETAAYENTIEHAALNGCSHIRAYEGTLEAIEGEGYGLILANINRNVILESFGPLYAKINSNGHLLVSGILLKDRETVIEQATQIGFMLKDNQERGDWCCLNFVR